MNTENQISPPNANIGSFRFGVKPLEAQACGHDYLFSNQVFLDERAPGKTFYIQNGSNQTVGFWHVFIQENKCSDHYRLPFSQFYIDTIVDEPTLKSFIEFAITSVGDLGANSISLFLPPLCYDKVNLEKLSRAIGEFEEPKWVDTNQHIPVIEESFYDRLSNSFKSRIKKLHTLTWKFEVQTPQMLDEAYVLILNSMGRKDFPVNMTLEQLHKAFSDFPESYFLFSVMNQNELIAAGISVRINADILYNIFHSDADSHRHLSPTIALIEGIYEFAKKSKFQILDLGTSSVEGITNQGLFNFKKKLGAISTEKTKYLLELSNA